MKKVKFGVFLAAIALASSFSLNAQAEVFKKEDLLASDKENAGGTGKDSS